MRLVQLIKNELEMFLVLFDRVTVYKYIVKIYVYKSSDIILENNSHEPLECSRGVTVSLLHIRVNTSAPVGDLDPYLWVYILSKLKPRSVSNKVQVTRICRSSTRENTSTCHLIKKSDTNRI